MRNEQLEFDLVSPLLAEPTPAQMEKVRRIMRLPVPGTPDELQQLCGLTARLNHLELVHDDGQFSINDELEQLRFVIGKDDWRKHKKMWTGRSKKDALRFRKVLFSIKKSLGL